MRHRIIVLSVLAILACAGFGEGPRTVVLPAQDLLLGGDPGEEGYSPRELRHRVVLSPYAIGVTEVTNAELCAFLNEEGNVAAFGNVPAIVLDERSGIRRDGERFVPAEGRERHPVTRVTWQGARAYCAWLSRRTGQHYDLPTAAQWEAAARGGMSTAWPWGSSDDPARHRTRAAAPVAVASYPPNAFGLHDTSGNVWEWVLDCFDPEFHRYAPLRNPVRFDEQCLSPEIRGGSFLDGSDSARPAFRANYWWAPQVDGIGFRVARAVAAGSRVQLTWMHARTPAASLEVRFDDAAPQRSDANGMIDVPPGAKTIAVRDPETGLELLARELDDRTPLAVPEPVRVNGVVAGRHGRLTARAGDGMRGDAVTRFHREVGALVEKRPAHSPFGVALPETPMHWTSAVVQGSRFTTGWLIADPAPQLLLFDESGAAAFREVAVPASIRPRAAIDAGTIALEPPATLDVRVAVPGDAAPSLQLHVLRGSMGGAARELAVLDQRDRRLFALLALGEPYYLPAGGRARLQLPPWISSARVVLRDSFEAGGIERDVALRAGGVTMLNAAMTDVVPAAQGQTFAGVVASGDPAHPVPDASVVVADGARRRETKTDAAGRFRFDDVRARPPVALFVDTRQAGARTHHRTAVFRQEPAPDLSLTMPAVHATRASPDGLSGSGLAPCSVGDDQYPIVVAKTVPPGATYAIDVDWNMGTLTVSSDTPGMFVFDVYATPFVGFTATADVHTATPAVAMLNGPTPEAITLLLQAHDGSPLTEGLELAFSPPPDLEEWLDATELDVDSNSSVTLPCVNINPLALYVDDGAGGGCDGTLVVTGTECRIQLPLDATQPCSCATATDMPAEQVRRRPQ